MVRELCEGREGDDRPEFRARKRAGFDVRLLGEDDVRRTFGFAAPAAILSRAGATCHPYKLTDALLRDFKRMGGRVYDLTRVVGWSETKTRIEVTTAGGPRIRARHVIVAAGYETQGFLDRQVTSFLRPTRSPASRADRATRGIATR